jgi:hypothetical protein
MSLGKTLQEGGYAQPPDQWEHMPASVARGGPGDGAKARALAALGI